MYPFFNNIVVDSFVRGGYIMWPILACFIAAVVVVLERAFWWSALAKRAKSEALGNVFDCIGRGEFSEAEKLTRAGDDPFLATIRRGLIYAHLSLLGAMQLQASDEIEKADRRLWILATFITLAPLLGLLGTVTGIMGSFDAIHDDALSPVAVKGGIAEALIATACGLGIAIACLLPYNFFNRRLAHFRSRLERTINHVELLVESAKHHGNDVEAFAKNFANGEAGKAGK